MVMVLGDIIRSLASRVLQSHLDTNPIGQQPHNLKMSTGCGQPERGPPLVIHPPSKLILGCPNNNLVTPSLPLADANMSAVKD